ncbi:MAG TPA: D-glucuronyl C5-epimerase family protein, partial [Gaiellaceae bacterium]|nr:D-glucuronyl C5-epimerase family protein [Gaiellaceae bacterium]
MTSAELHALAKLKSAQSAGRIDAATASSARAEIARAAHLIRTLPNGRGYHVRVALDEAASFRAALTLPRALELYGALKANDDYFSAHWPPADHTDYTDADGLVYRYYAGYCFRFHPLADFGALNARVAAGDVEGTQALADALIERGVYQKGGGIGWEYDFDFGGGRAPWLSGMAQAVAAQAFAGAAALVTDRSKAYMTEATAAERLIPKRLTTTVSGGPWIKLYGFSSLVVFNAQLQATLSLQSFAQASGDAPAAALAARMASTAYKLIPRFDTGYWSYYALPHEPSPVAYHAFVVTLLKKLAKTDPRFADAATRFAAYEKEPPAFQLANAGVGQVKFWLSKPATVKLESAAGPTKSLSLDGGWHTVVWSPKQAGIYGVHVTATDWVGNKTEFDTLPVVRVGSAVAASATRRLAAVAKAVPGQPSFTVGAGLDDPSQAALVQSLGLRLVRFGVAWPAAATVPDPSLVGALASTPAGLAELVELNSGTIPSDPTTTGQLAQYAAALAQQVPALRYLVLSPSPTAATATTYEITLAAIAQAVHAV